jgi:hypothetical protein
MEFMVGTGDVWKLSGINNLSHSKAKLDLRYLEVRIFIQRKQKYRESYENTPLIHKVTNL